MKRRGDYLPARDHTPDCARVQESRSSKKDVNRIE
jgi:hypothetical protein